MTDKDFEVWFYDHIDEMVENGIMHPKSQAAKWVKLALSAALSHYESELSLLANRISALEGNPIKVSSEKVMKNIKVEKPKSVTKKIKETVETPKKVVSKQQWL